MSGRHDIFPPPLAGEGREGAGGVEAHTDGDANPLRLAALATSPASGRGKE
jgi:hypothetical protein